MDRIDWRSANARQGIGQVAAEKLAAMGARTVLVARNKARAGATLARLRELGPATAHIETLVYLASPQEVAAAPGGYYFECDIATLSASAQDPSLARRLWAETAKLAALQED
jgi:NAD(P)-dependent dehydrogenase (short-subunit alcohol dehydrogenase family)